MSDTRSDTPGARGRGAGTGGQGGDTGVLDQAQSAMRGATEAASDMWEGATDRGRQMYRQGSRTMGDMDATTMAGLLVAGAVGFALAWLVFGNRYADDMVRGMSRAGRYGSEGERRMRRH